MKSAQIHYLTDEIINKIAAGEVIERPASAVKEMMENAIDAGASRIQVQVEQGGKKKILVSDNGCGMSLGDLNLCFLRHTTSKLFKAEDLFHLKTNGFRGEAVASIAAVSKMTITSANDEESNQIVIQGGNVIKKEPVSASKGTTFLIEDLFFNTPVRKTFLGSDTSECTKILDFVLKIAIAHPEIRFDYKVNDKTLFIGVPGDLRSRLAEAIGSGVAKNLLPVDYTEAGVHVSGFISPTTETNGKRHHQFLFMRNRPIESKTIAKAVSQAYEPYGAQCKPVSVLFLDMPDIDFDVNVHPAKREVRFANQSLVFLVVTHAIRETLKKEFEKNNPIIELSDEFLSNPSINYVKESRNDSNYTPEKDEVQDLFSQPEAGKLISIEGNTSFFANEQKQSPLWEAPTLFQIADTYIVSKDNDGLLIIDQHAAHCRILYEQALDILQNNGSVDCIELLFPELIEFSKMEKSIFPSVENSLKKLGFYIEPFGGDTYQVRAAPSKLHLSRISKAIHDFLSDCIKEEKNLDETKFQNTIAKNWAKSNSFQAGDKLKPEEMSNLMGLLMTTEDPLKSPFNNPILMRISLDELARKFKH